MLHDHHHLQDHRFSAEGALIPSELHPTLRWETSSACQLQRLLPPNTDVCAAHISSCSSLVPHGQPVFGSSVGLFASEANEAQRGRVICKRSHSAGSLRSRGYLLLSPF